MLWVPSIERRCTLVGTRASGFLQPSFDRFGWTQAAANRAFGCDSPTLARYCPLLGFSWAE